MCQLFNLHCYLQKWSFELRRKKKEHHLPTRVIMLGFIPKHINHWLGILTNWSTFLIRVCLCLQRTFFDWLLILTFLPPDSAFWWTWSFPFISVVSLANDPCTLGSSCADCWPLTVIYSINPFSNWQLNQCLYWVSIFFGPKGHM